MIDLSKEERIHRIDLRKKEVINLTKDTELENLTSRVALVLDCSASMEDMYDDGRIQEVIERILPLAMKFDDNGELDLWLFSNSYVRCDGVTLDNFYGLVDKIQDKAEFLGTNYAPVMLDIINTYIYEDPASIPSYVIFITDGENFDEAKAEDTVVMSAKYPIFWQFVGIGNTSFKFLSHLDEMEGRLVDNANFFQLNDLDKISDNQLYKRLLQEYPQWLGYSEVKDMLINYKKLQSDSLKDIKKIKRFSIFRSVARALSDLLG